MDGSNYSKWIILIGLILIVIGIIFWMASKVGIFFGKLPGDIYVHKENTSFYFPIVTSIIVSVILTIVINIIIMIMRK